VPHKSFVVFFFLFIYKYFLISSVIVWLIKSLLFNFHKFVKFPIFLLLLIFNHNSPSPLISAWLLFLALGSGKHAHKKCIAVKGCKPVLSPSTPRPFKFCRPWLVSDAFTWFFPPTFYTLLIMSVRGVVEVGTNSLLEFIYLLIAIPEFEIRAPHLLGRCSTTWNTPQPFLLLVIFFHLGSWRSPPPLGWPWTMILLPMPPL
jgi:hypothetical protein